eukprot:103675_1
MGALVEAISGQTDTDPLIFKLQKNGDVTAINEMSFKINNTTIAFTTISEISEVNVISNKKMPHYGLIFRNQFIVSGYSIKYKYLLVHALGQTTDKTKLKLDITLSNHLNTIKQRLSALVGKTANNVKSTEWKRVSKYATMRVIVNAFNKIIDNKFDIYCEDKMALQQYNGIMNCALSAKYFYATVMNISSQKYIEDWIQQNRGTLLKRKQVNIDNIQQGVPAKGGKIFWTTLNEVVIDNIVYRLQRHKDVKFDEIKEGYVKSAVVHEKMYRIIKRNKTNDMQNEENKYDDKDDGYNWRDIYRTDDFTESEKQFNIFTESPWILINQIKVGNKLYHWERHKDATFDDNTEMYKFESGNTKRNIYRIIEKESDNGNDFNIVLKTNSYDEVQQIFDEIPKSYGN